MTTPKTVVAYRKRKSSEGYRIITIVLDPTSSKPLSRLIAKYGNQTKAINAAIKGAK